MSTVGAPIIELRSVTKVYSTESGDFHALNRINMQVGEGEFLGIVGKSGAGKSTLLNMITGVDHLTSGKVLFRGNAQEISVHELDEDALALWRLPAYTSGGQQQRVAIARSLANDPAILVADEPTGSLDSVTADHIFDIFERLVQESAKTIIMVTHDHSLAPRFTRHLQIADGELAGVSESLEQSGRGQVK